MGFCKPPQNWVDGFIPCYGNNGRKTTAHINIINTVSVKEITKKKVTSFSILKPFIYSYIYIHKIFIFNLKNALAPTTSNSSSHQRIFEMPNFSLAKRSRKSSTSSGRIPGPEGVRSMCFLKRKWWYGTKICTK